MTCTPRLTLRSCALLWPLVGLLVLGGCSADSPTQPQQNPGPGNPAPSATWNITVTITPDQLSAGAASPATVRITVRRASDNQPPPDGTTAAVSTSLGSFNAQNSGVTSGPINLVGGQASILLFAGDVPGTAIVTVTLETSVGRGSVLIAGAATFFIGSITPNLGNPSGDEVVRVQGGGFAAPVQVLFGDTPGVVLEVTSSTIRVRTPALAGLQVGQTQTVTITVNINVGTGDEVSDSLQNAFTYTYGSVTGPQVFSVDPRSGPNEGGTRVVIRGDGFSSPVQVLFGLGTTASPFVEAAVDSVSTTEIRAVTPAATGFGQGNQDLTVSLRIRNLNSGQESTLLSAFTYGIQCIITALGPGSGPPTGGQLVTVFGQGFDEPVAVSLAGFGQQVLSVTGTEIEVRTVAIFTTNCSDVSAAVSVTSIETGDSCQGPVYTYRVEASTPSFGSPSPSSGTQAGGTQVTFTGSNLNSPLQVLFADRPGTVVSANGSTVTVRTPPLPDAELDTQACDGNGDGQANGEQFIPTAVPVEIINGNTTCSASFDGLFTYTPTDNSCRNDTTGGGGTTTPPTAGFSEQFTGNPREWLFTDTSTGSPTSWSWNFGDPASGANNTSALQNPIHTFSAAGNYVVSLTASNAGGSDSTSRVINVP